jgi:cell division transport system permease protein
MRTRFSFYFSEAMRSLSTNKATSFAAVVAMLVALLIVGITSVFFLKARAEGQNIAKDAGIVKVFLTPNITDEQFNALKSTLERNPNVEKVDFITKEAALKRAKSMFKNTPGVIQNLAGNPFPASLEAKLRDPSRMDEAAKTMKGQPGVDSVSTGGETAKKAINVIRWITVVFFAIGLGILIAATVLVANTIRLSIYSRRREIEVMKLVGASNGFVRMPFMIEGFLCGIFAALIAMVSVVLVVKLLGNSLKDTLHTDTLGAASGDVPLGMIALGLVVLGTLLGMIASASSMRKYLKT